LNNLLYYVNIIVEKGGGHMPKKSASKVTSPKVASTASKILNDGRFGKASKSVAGSALAQAKGRK
jgi:hypothetical protein